MMTRRRHHLPRPPSTWPCRCLLSCKRMHTRLSLSVRCNFVRFPVPNRLTWTLSPCPPPPHRELSPSTSPAHPSCVSDGGSPTAEASDAVGAVPSDDVAPSMPLLDKADVVTPSSPKFDSPRTAAEVEPALDHEVVAAEVTEFAKTLAAKNAGGADGSTPSSPNGALKKKRSKKKKAKKASRSKSPPRATA